jgi:YegS/Rv2252/BmrU family lipid kinase
MTQRIPLVIVNPTAGSGRGLKFWDRCERACVRGGVKLDVVFTARPGDAIEAAAEAVGDRLVVAVGVDGTAHEVVNGLLRNRRESRPRFGALMCGTGKDLARTLPSPDSPRQVAKWFQTDSWRTVDAGRVTTSTGSHFFINAADVGIGAEVVRRAARGPSFAGGSLNFLGAAIFSLMVHRNEVIQIGLDGQRAETGAVRTVAITNGAYVGGRMWIAPQADPSDGLFEVVTIGDVGRWEGITSLPLLYRGQHGRLEKVRFARARRVEIDAAQPIGIEADGELVGTTPAVFEVVPAALDIIRWKA